MSDASAQLAAMFAGGIDPCPGCGLRCGGADITNFAGEKRRCGRLPEGAISVCPGCGWIGCTRNGRVGPLTQADRKTLRAHTLGEQVKACHDKVVERLVG